MCLHSASSQRSQRIGRPHTLQTAVAGVVGRVAQVGWLAVAGRGAEPFLGTISWPPPGTTLSRAMLVTEPGHAVS
jgi:hypothetical protein